jgi:hypothetical protein
LVKSSGDRPTCEPLCLAVLTATLRSRIAHSASYAPTLPAFCLSEDFLGGTSYTNSIPSPSPPLPVVVDDWPATLPPKPLLFHLIDLFFTCWPNSHRLIHRPSFLIQLLESPSSPRFPYTGLLHAMCAAAAVHSPYVTVAPLPNLRTRPSEDIFQEKTRLLDGRMLSFDEEHFLLSKYQCMASAREGDNFFGVIQGMSFFEHIRRAY